MTLYHARLDCRATLGAVMILFSDGALPWLEQMIRVVEGIVDIVCRTRILVFLLFGEMVEGLQMFAFLHLYFINIRL